MAQCAKCGSVKLTEQPCPQCGSRQNYSLLSAPDESTFIHIEPKTDACDHNFKGWRPFEDGNGGEAVCTKCGMGAMHYSLMTSD